MKKWASTSQFVASKLEERLKAPQDAIETKVAEVIFDRNMRKMDLKPIPTLYEYVSGDGDIKYPKSKLALN